MEKQPYGQRFCITPKAAEITPKVMEITPKPMEIEIERPGKLDKVFYGAEFYGRRIFFFLAAHIVIAFSDMRHDRQPRFSEKFHSFKHDRV